MATITDRVKKIIEIKSLSPSQLADSISVNRSRLSHILTGRNNPSLDIVQNILNAYPDISPEWLIFGQGNIFRQQEDIGKQALGGLFEIEQSESNISTRKSETDKIFKPEGVEKQEFVSKVIDNQLDNKKKDTLNHSIQNNYYQDVISKQSTKRRVKMITIFYDDNEYEILYPESSSR